MQGQIQETCAAYEQALAQDGTNREIKELFDLAIQAFSVLC